MTFNKQGMKGALLELSYEDAMALGIQEHPAWSGAFTRHHAPGAIPNGTWIVKVRVDDDFEIHPIGHRGTVLGSIHVKPVGYGYFVEWEGSPGIAVFVSGSKINAA